MMRCFKILAQGFFLFYGLYPCMADQIKNRTPNIIFIMADDLGWQDVGFMGSQWFETPNLDKVAEESLVFTNAYMYPTCSPSRAALLTGKQSFRTGVYNVPVLEKGDNNHNIFSRWTVGLEHTMYAAPLKEAGYRSIHLGKWHVVGPHPDEETDYPFVKPLKQPANGSFDWLEKHKSAKIQQYYPTGKGFHENVGGTWWGDPARGYEAGYRSESGGYIAPFNNPFIEEKESDEWLTDRLTDEAIDFIKRNKDQPFFVNLHYYAPHRPTVPRNEEWLQKFLEKSPDEHTGQGSNNLEEIAGYATMIASLDENVQRIFDYLDKEGLRENTLVIFTSDNGFNGLQSGTNTLRGAKGTVYEGGIRVPALVNWKGQVAPGVSDVPVSGMDYFPTFLELAGVNNYTGVLDGESLVPLLEQRELKERPLFWHIASTYKNPPCSIIRKGKWKLIQFLLDGEIELYDLEKDVKESNNLADERPVISAQLVDELTKWRKQHQVPLPSASKLVF
ncbi:sulfatase [Echinicola strongylocentroti]|uniref:Sulfatase n=1 Tax=Echinicola strongylocentroti TaxID=1795355 RepID=A0A2Z4IR04_9BACT|nr:sulfatase [Echinicola strongylocentroti]AWW32733.1 sulfatase [Echinicola strongylocentroti]